MNQFLKRLRGLLLLAVMSVCFSVSAIAAGTLIPGGNTVGIRLQTEGFLISGFDENSAADAAGLRKGDRIVEVDHVPLRRAEQLLKALESGEPVALTLIRGGKEAQYLVKPNQTDNGWRLGVYLRDHIAGIGTVTYYDPQSGVFGALGHGVCDQNGRSLFPVTEGILIASGVESVKKGEKGVPGELHGSFEPERILGKVCLNSEFGLFGVMDTPPEGEAVGIAGLQEVKCGGAVIRANVSGRKVEEFSVRIDRVDADADNGRDFLLTVTDPRLLELTGGVVQGMSGSPILQNGKLVGAVTHVLVNDPTRGYGIYIGNMLAAADPMQQLHIGERQGNVRNDLIHILPGAERQRLDEAEFGMVAQKNLFRAVPHHDLPDGDLLLRNVRQQALLRDGQTGKEHEIGMNVFKEFFRQSAQIAFARLIIGAAGHDHPDTAAAQLRQYAKVVRKDREIAFSFQKVADAADSGGGIHQNGIAVMDSLRRHAGDLLLSGGIGAVAHGDGDDLIAVLRQLRTAVDALHQPLSFQLCNVPPHGGLADVEQLRKAAVGQHMLCRQQLQDRFLPSLHENPPDKI